MIHYYNKYQYYIFNILIIISIYNIDIKYTSICNVKYICYYIYIVYVWWNRENSS